MLLDFDTVLDVKGSCRSCLAHSFSMMFFSDVWLAASGGETFLHTLDHDVEDVEFARDAVSCHSWCDLILHVNCRGLMMCIKVVRLVTLMSPKVKEMTFCRCSTLLSRSMLSLILCDLLFSMSLLLLCCLLVLSITDVLPDDSAATVLTAVVDFCYLMSDLVL